MANRQRSLFGKKKRLTLKSLLVSVFLLLLIAFGYATVALRASLADLNGQLGLDGLSDQVVVSRDNQGIVDIQATSRKDLAQALGFVHAQERFFQMDLSRRNAAGELSSLFGSKALDYDKSIRIHQFRQRARELVANLNPADRSILESYSRGVNQGLAQLEETPFEYLLLRAKAEKWQPEDSLLVVYSMYLVLQSRDGFREHLNGLARANLPLSVSEFLLPQGTSWDSPIEGSALPAPDFPNELAWQSVIDSDSITSVAELSADTSPTFPVETLFREPLEFGSNQWAVAGELSSHPAAMLAGDMHLGIRVPNTWFRAQMHYQTAGKKVNLFGVTLPGTPLLIVGSNQQIAWSFTNSYGDWADLIELELDQNQTHYGTPTGPKEVETQTETIKLHDGTEETFEFQTTEWGPVVNHHGKHYAYRWMAHHPKALNIRLIDLETTNNVEQAVAVAKTIAIPAQNFMVVDNQGNLGWTIAGQILNFDNAIDRRFPLSGSATSIDWPVALPVEAYPVAMNPANQYLWTANNRVVSDQAFSLLGDGGLALGARARQIEEGLKQLKVASENDLLNIQLDDRAKFLARWRGLMLKAFAQSNDPKFLAMQSAVANWSGRASKEDVGYWLVKSFRQRIAQAVLNPLYQSSLPKELINNRPNYAQFTRQYEGPLWEIIERRPVQLLPAPYSSWQAFFQRQLEKQLEILEKEQKSLEDLRWGVQNTARIQHPISSAVPILGYFLDMPAQEMSGDRDMPYVQGRAFGASQRLVVSPGYEAQGILHMPTGQSGHPLSPFYRKGHQDWVAGTASPLLMQTKIHELVLTPKTIDRN